jgi:peptidoglycan-associated lipoprotein
MRTLTLKLASALFIVALVSACSSSKTASTGGESTSSASSSGVSSSGVQSSSMSSSTSSSSKAMMVSNGNTIYFDYDSDVIRPDGREVLMEHAARLKKGGRATLEGHCDERGSREYNIALGERRAKAVRDFLVIQGVNSTQLEVVSYGEERPVDPASNEMAWAKNRRVEIK